MPRSSRAIRWLFLVLALTTLALVPTFACGDSGATTTGAGGGSTSGNVTTGGGSGQGGSGGSGGALFDGGNAGGGDAGGACTPPDVLILLDRTLTMHFTPAGQNPTDAPEYKSSKWHQAITAIRALVSPPLDQTIRFGLELWPKESEGCITLAERIEDTKQATNPACEAGDVVVPPALGTSDEIDKVLDPATTKICSTTPTGQALLSGLDYLKQNGAPGREQYIVLVTDGADWDFSCPDPAPLPIVQQLAKEGIKTFIVGFSSEGGVMQGGVGAEFLNDMACAGQTAKGFPAGCVQQGDGYVAADPKGPSLYLQAGSGNDLTASLQAIGAQLCCDCNDPCTPPDMMIALDRTLTMHRTPSSETPTDAPEYKSSKWYQAISAIETLVTPPLDQTIRFGLELWPKESDGCITLAERVENTKQATNMWCQDGEVVVPPGLGAGGAITSLLDPATTRICSSTPTGQGLITASNHLIANAAPGRPQYILLLTDGADWDQSCPEPAPLPIVQTLSASGIKTFVVGFFTEAAVPNGVGKAFLNDMACAGQTAKGFPAPCMLVNGGYVAADPDGDVLYLEAGDAASLGVALQSVAGEICCDCPK